MADAVGTLRVDVVAKTSKFNSGLDKAGKKVSWFGGKVATARKKFSGFASSFSVGVLGLGALVIAVKRSAESIDKLGKTSSKLGIPVERLQELRFAAKQSGIAINTFDMAMQRMTRRVSEAAVGTGEAQAAIKELGLDAEELGMLTPDKMLARVADAMRNVKNPSDRLRLAFKLFDSEGAALVNMLSNGSAGLREFAAEAQATGGVLGKDLVDDVEKATNAIGRLELTMQGAMGRLAVFGAQLVNWWEEQPIRIAILAAQMEISVGKILGRDVSIWEQRLEQFRLLLVEPKGPAGGLGGGLGVPDGAPQRKAFTPPAALAKGSAAAFSAILKAGRAGGAKKPRIEEIAEQELKAAVEQNRILQLIWERTQQQQLAEANL